MLTGVMRNVPGADSFYPQTFILPTEWGEWLAARERHKHTGQKEGDMWAVKPVHGADGEGITFKYGAGLLATALGGAPGAASGSADTDSVQAVQHYVSMPQTLAGFKFDFRVFVTLLGLAPLRAYVYNEGYSKYAATKYQSGCPSCLGMHLTNSHSVHRNGPACDLPRTITETLDALGLDHEQVWRKIRHAVRATVRAAVRRSMATLGKDEQPSLFCTPGATVGFDFIMDRRGGVWMLEVNAFPGPFFGMLPCPGDPPADAMFLLDWTHLLGRAQFEARLEDTKWPSKQEQEQNVSKTRRMNTGFTSIHDVRA
jgi:hypothetical protein